MKACVLQAFDFFCFWSCAYSSLFLYLIYFQGYTIPLDKRLAADGRGLQTVHINENFAKLAEALYIADRKVLISRDGLICFSELSLNLFVCFLLKWTNEMLVVSIGQRGSGDESPGGEEDGPEREGKERGETQGVGPNGPRSQGRN